MVFLMRLSAVDDVFEEGNLHLMRLVPLAWVRSDYETKFEDMPTEYGPVSLKFRLSEDGEALMVDWQPKFRTQPDSVILHVPPVDGLKKVIINGMSHRISPGEIIKVK